VPHKVPLPLLMIGDQQYIQMPYLFDMKVTGALPTKRIFPVCPLPLVYGVQSIASKKSAVWVSFPLGSGASLCPKMHRGTHASSS
jgi:hypothetical protein